MSPLINISVWRGIRTFQTAISGNKEHRRSVRRLYARATPLDHEKRTSRD
jgi:hypothetical protein